MCWARGYMGTLYCSILIRSYKGFPGGSADKESTCNEGDLGSIPGLEKSSGEGNGYPLQYAGLENLGLQRVRHD